MTACSRSWSLRSIRYGPTVLRFPFVHVRPVLSLCPSPPPFLLPMASLPSPVWPGHHHLHGCRSPIRTPFPLWLPRLPCPPLGCADAEVCRFVTLVPTKTLRDPHTDVSVPHYSHFYTLIWVIQNRHTRNKKTNHQDQPRRHRNPIPRFCTFAHNHSTSDLPKNNTAQVLKQATLRCSCLVTQRQTKDTRKARK